MRKVVLAVLLLFFSLASLCAQEITRSVTVYDEFKPAIIQLTDGRKISQPFANVFLKNGRLLYKRGTQTMEANMDNIAAVDFDDRHYLKIDTLLAYPTDSLGLVYCADLMDLEAYQGLLRNNKQLTNLELGSMVNMTSIELDSDAASKMPIKKLFLLKIRGEYLQAHERVIQRKLSKPQRRILNTIISTEGFKWSDPESLLRLVKAIDIE